MNILITGHSGYIGSVLAHKLSRDNNVILFEGDVSKKSNWENNLSTSIDIIYHLAAVEPSNPFRPDWGHTQIDKEWQVNSYSVIHIHEACTKKNISPKIVFVSSTNVFGCVDTKIVDEETTEDVAAFWSLHKLLGEKYLRILNKMYDTKFTVLMLPNVYGPSRTIELTDRMTLNKVINQAITSNELELYDNKMCLRDCLYIDDVVNAFELMLYLPDTHFNGDRFLLGSDKKITIESFWTEIAQQVPSTIIKYNNKKLTPYDYRNYISDISKFNRVTNWYPEVSLTQGISNTIGVYK